MDVSTNHIAQNRGMDLDFLFQEGFPDVIWCMEAFILS